METQADHSGRNIPAGTETHSADYAPYPKIDHADLEPPPPPQPFRDPPSHKPTGRSSSPPTEPTFPQNPAAGHEATSFPDDRNPYINPSPIPSSSKNKMETVKDVLGKWGKKLGETAKKTEDLAGNVWQHLKTGPSVADAAMSRIAQGTKVIAEGGYEKIFWQTFDTVPEEQLRRSYACYLSTSAGPVSGTLYLSTTKLAFCSDNPLSYKIGDQTEWSYYKVIIPLHQLRSVNPTTSKANPAEKYIQIVSIDNHEFWFMGFMNYDGAVKHLQEALQGPHGSHS